MVQVTLMARTLVPGGALHDDGDTGGHHRDSPLKRGDAYRASSVRCTTKPSTNIALSRWCTVLRGRWPARMIRSSGAGSGWLDRKRSTRRARMAGWDLSHTPEPEVQPGDRGSGRQLEVYRGESREVYRGGDLH